MSGTDIALPSEQAPKTIASFITQLTPEIARALPKGMDGDRIARLALTVVRQSEMAAVKAGKPQNSLAVCSIESFAASLLTAAALGLEPGVNGEAYLVPYRRECQLIIGYQGYAKLFWQNPLARHLDAQAVYEADDFDYAYGTEPFLRHRPARQDDRGKVVAYYAVAGMANNGVAFEVLTPEQVKALRNGRVGTSGDIADPQRWMERKTVLRQLVKTLPRSTMLNAALVVDEAVGSHLRAEQVPQTIAEDQAAPALPEGGEPS